jgi:hypothetical protein
MNENIKWIACAVAVVGLSIGAVVYRDKWWRDKPPTAAKPPAAVPAEPVAPALPDEPAVKHPLPPAETQEPLPPLDASDEPVQKTLTELMGAESVEKFVFSQDLVRHFVATIDNLSEPKVAARIRPLTPVPGKFAVDGTEDAPVLDASNYERYKPVVQAMTSIDSQKLVATYLRYYPLLQQSYEGLGHPPEYFNDRMIQVIDHLLETPEVRDPIRLTRPGMLYEFKDPKLESLSAGQKLLIRMGGENAAAVKAKLREIRGVLESKADKPVEEKSAP